MPGPAGQLKKLYQQIIGGTSPGSTGNLSGDLSEQIQALIDRLLSTTDLGSFTASATGSLGEQLAYLQANGGGAKKVSGGGYRVMPANAASIAVTSGAGAWTKGAYAQVVASTSEDDYLVGFQLDAGAAGDAMELDIATGGAGAETVVSASVGRMSSATFLYPTYFPYPIEVASGTRIAVRAADATGSVATGVKLLYVKKSEMVAL